MENCIDNIQALDLRLDHDRNRASRGDKFVDFGGRCRLWDILTALASRHDCYFSVNELIAHVWNDKADASIFDATCYSHVSDLRKKLKSLGLGITHKKRIGYRLEIIEQPDGSSY